MSDTKSAVVTGAASGIGRATAERLIRDGWEVVGVDINDDMPAGVQSVVGDAAEPATIRRALQISGDRLDGLVCAAGIPPNEQWDDMADWDELLRVDLTGPFVTVSGLMSALVAAAGSVVIVGSIVGPVEGSARSPGYAAAKAGLEGLARSLALIGAPSGVRVNVVEPGAIDTPFDAPRLPPHERADVPLGRMGTADEVAGVIRYLLSDDASYVTGAIVRVDGGRTIRGPLG